MKHSKLLIDSFAFFVLAGLVFFVVQFSLKKEGEPPRVKQIQLMQEGELDFSFTNLEKKEKQSLSDFQGRAAIVNIWASWCLPCVEELPSLVKLAEAFPSDLVVIAVTEEEEEDVKKFLNNMELKKTKNFITALSSEVVEVFFPQALPETYIFDREGKLFQKVIGPRAWDSSEWKSEIREIISGSQ